MYLRVWWAKKHITTFVEANHTVSRGKTISLAGLHTNSIGAYASDGNIGWSAHQTRSPALAEGLDSDVWTPYQL